MFNRRFCSSFYRHNISNRITSYNVCYTKLLRYTATATGTYYVKDITSSTCISIDEVIHVIPYGNTITNPVIPFADLLPICPNDGKVLPYIFLCGGNTSRSITTGISDAVSIIWEKLDETSCAEMTIDDCANENPRNNFV